MKVKKNLISVLILFVLAMGQFVYPQAASATTILYAIPSGVDIGSCTSWGTACTLQYALSRSVAGVEIWVQQGTYKPTTDTDRNATFAIGDRIAIYGGFEGTETDRSQRSTNAALTILSGDIGTVGNISDNSYRVVTMISASSSTVIDGLTVTLGNSNTGVDDYGGGLHIVNSSPTFNNLIISNNRAGSTQGTGGGGMFISDTDGLPYVTPHITNVTFSNNQSGRGGGLFSQNSNPILENVTFIENIALTTGGGGMNAQVVSASDPLITPSLTNVAFINNTATGGAGLFMGTSNGTLTNVTFSGNTANRRGGGLLMEFSSPVLTNVTFYNNTSNNNGADPRGGGGLQNFASSPTLNNVTFSGNISNANGVSGGAMMIVRDTVTLTISNPVISNSIFWGNHSTEIISDGTGTITVSDSVVQDGCPAGATCTNVLSSDPLLNALANNGGYTQTMALSAGSPAINTGNNATCASTDQRGMTRPQPQGGQCDMGAYEYEFLTITATPDTPTNTTTPTNIPTDTATFVPTDTAMPTETATLTPTLASTPTATPTNVPTDTATFIPTETTTLAPTFTSTPTQTSTASLTPTNTATFTPTITPTILVSLTPSIFPSTNVLDTFNRTNGGLGANWGGTISGYRIVSKQMDVNKGGAIFWKAKSRPFGKGQEVFVTLTKVDTNAREIDLLLKSQSSTSWKKGGVKILYNPAAHVVQVWTYASGQGWIQRGADIPVTFVDGDQFGVRAKVNGMVEVYRNGVLIGTSDVSSWSYYASGGYIGLWLINAGSAITDNFGGGSITP